jgi:acetyl esterase
MTAVIEPATGALLTQIRESGGKPLSELTVDEARAVVRASSERLAGPRVEVGAALDRTIDTRAGKVPVRVYTPAGTHLSSLPVIVYFHGGGFAAGDLDTHDSNARYVCQNAGAIVVAVDYRRPPEHRFPAAVDDAYATVEWVAAHAGEFGGDATRLAVAGDSAGGNLAAVVAQLARQHGGPRLAFQALFYPLVDFTLTPTPSRSQFGGGDFFLSNADMVWFRQLYLDDPAQAADPRVSPLLASDVSQLPPALIIAAQCDPLYDEGKAYADRLAAAGVPVEHRCFDGTIHAFMSFSGAIPVGRDALAFAAARLRAALHQSQS